MYIEKVKLIYICTRLYLLGFALDYANRSLDRLCDLSSRRAVRAARKAERIATRFAGLEKQAISLFLRLYAPFQQ